MITISRKAFFSSGVNSPRSEYGTGHNFCLNLFLTGPIDEISGLVINLTDVNILLKKLTEELDHKHLGKDHPYFKTRDTEPTTILAYICQWLLDRWKQELSNDVKLTKVSLSWGRADSIEAKF